MDVDPLEVVFFRNVFNLLFMLPWFLKIGVAGLRNGGFGLHFIRTASSLTSMFFWFTALTLLPLAEATSLSFTAPLFATVGAAIFLAEDVRLRRWLAVALGFVGPDYSPSGPRSGDAWCTFNACRVSVCGDVHSSREGSEPDGSPPTPWYSWWR